MITHFFSNFEYFWFRIYLRRTFTGIFLQNVLPSILLTIVVFSSNLYYKERFEAAVTVNVTCLLSISSFFIAVFQTLPDTTDIKILDWLLIKSIILASAITLFQTFDLQLSMRKQYMMTRVLRMIIFYVIPTIELCVDVLFVIVGILYDYDQISLSKGSEEY